MFNPFRANGIFHKAIYNKSGWSIVYIERSHVIVAKKILYSSLKIDFVLANSAGPDEMLYYVTFHLGLCYLPNYPFSGFWSVRG